MRKSTKEKLLDAFKEMQKMGAHNKTKAKLAATRNRLKEANAMKSKHYNELKNLESKQQEHAAQILNLTWALHKESCSEVLSKMLLTLSKPELKGIIATIKSSACDTHMRVNDYALVVE